MKLSETEQQRLLTLPDSLRRISSARELLRALADSFPQALAQNRTTAWAKAAHSIIDLLAEEDAPAPGVQEIPADRIHTALDSPGCERLRDFYEVGPVQRAAVEAFADALAAGVLASENDSPKGGA